MFSMKDFINANTTKESQKRKFTTKALRALTGIMVGAMFVCVPPTAIATFTGPTVVYAATAPVQTIQAEDTTIEAVSFSTQATSGAIQYKTQHPGVAPNTDSYQYDTGISVTLDGKLVQLTHDGTTPAYPVLVDNRTFVPLRAVGELLGASVDYDSANGIIIVKAANGTTLETYNGANVLIKNGKIAQGITDGVRVFIKEGRAYMPLRTAVEAVGFGVNWNSNTRTVEITSPGQTTPGGNTSPADRTNVEYDASAFEYGEDGYNNRGYDRNGYDRNGVHWSVKAMGHELTQEETDWWNSMTNGN